jgi:hypothetical protein
MPDAETNSRRSRMVVGLVGLLALSACSSHKRPPDSAVLTVSVGAYGGPFNPTTGMQTETGAPIPNQRVTITDTAGRIVRATTDSAGFATLHLAPGSYSVSSESCPPAPGSAGQPLTLLPNATAHYQVACQVP